MDAVLEPGEPFGRDVMASARGSEACSGGARVSGWGNVGLGAFGAYGGVGDDTVGKL